MRVDRHSGVADIAVVAMKQLEIYGKLGKKLGLGDLRCGAGWLVSQAVPTAGIAEVGPALSGAAGMKTASAERAIRQLHDPG